MQNEDTTPTTLEFPVVSNLSPEIPIEIIGQVKSNKVVATLDTGFTGFLQIPIAVGISSNLTLWSISNSRLADGRMIKNLDCVGNIRFGMKTMFGIINLSETGEDCLLGMQFLEQLGGCFSVDIAKNKAIFTFDMPNNTQIPQTTTNPLKNNTNKPHKKGGRKK